MTAWLITRPHWLNDWFTDGLLTEWLPDWWNDLISEWHWFTAWLTPDRMTAWLITWPHWLNDWFTDGLLTEWLHDWLNDLITDWIISSRSDCLLTEWPPDWLNDLTNWMNVWQTSCLLTKRVSGWFNYRSLILNYWLAYGPTPCSGNDRLTVQLNGWQTEWQGYWMNDYKWLLIPQTVNAHFRV